MRGNLAGLLVCVVVVSPIGCKRLKIKDKEREEAEMIKEADKESERLVAGKSEDGDKVLEAREYLSGKDKKNGLWKTSREQTLKWVDELYKAGAAKVYAVYSPADENIKINMCASLLVELPTGEKRPAVIAAFDRIEKKIWGEDHEPTKDMGQKYLDLSMDP